MFRPKSPQKSLFDIGSLLPKKKLSQLERTWAGPFREKVLPLIDEYGLVLSGRRCCPLLMNMPFETSMISGWGLPIRLFKP
jgi:hypothetical protein